MRIRTLGLWALFVMGTPGLVMAQSMGGFPSGGNQRFGTVNDQGAYYFDYDNQGNVRYYSSPTSPGLVPAPSPGGGLPGGYPRLGITNDRGNYVRYYDNQGRWGTKEFYQGLQNPDYQLQYQGDVARWRYRNQAGQYPPSNRMPNRRRSSWDSFNRTVNQYQSLMGSMQRYWSQFPGYGGSGGFSTYRGYGSSGGFGSLPYGNSSSRSGSGGSDPRQLVMPNLGPKR